jgi:hypothetical protein
VKKWTTTTTRMNETYHLLEMGEAEDRVVDLDRFAREDVGHGWG